MVAAMLRLPAGSPLAGRPLTLAEAIASARDRPKQLEIVHAYWRLALALGEYRARFDHAEQLARLQSRPADGAVVRAAQSSASAAVRAAEVAAVSAQHELAESAMLASTLPLPIPSDLPHVGGYRTNYDEIYARLNLAPRVRLIHRTLPVRRRAIDVRASAVEAADDAVQAASDAYRTGDVDLFAVLSAMNQLSQQRRALLASVCEYNHDIADFALTVVGPEVSGPAVVGLLIRTSAAGTPSAAPPANPANPSTPLRPEPDRGLAPPPAGTRPGGAAAIGTGNFGEVRPANFDQPALTLPQMSLPLQPRTFAEPQPTLAPPQAAPAEEKRPLLAPPDDSTGKSAETPLRFVPDAATGAQSVPHVTRRSAYAGAAPSASTALYSALVDAPPTTRAKQLAAWLHEKRTVPGQSGEAADLATTLRRVYNADRKGVLDAYWVARQRAAEYHVLAQQNDLFQQFVPVALERRSQPSGAREMVRIHADQRAGQADLLDAQIRMMEAQFELTLQARRPPDASWLLPTTAPIAVPYALKLESRPHGVTNLAVVRRLSATIPTLYETVQQRAIAVVEADAAQASVGAAYRSGRQSIEDLLAAVRQETQEAIGFLESITSYNHAIVEYVVTVLPPSLPANDLLKTLVVTN